MEKYNNLSELLHYLADNRIIPAMQMAVSLHDRVIFCESYGSIFETGFNVNNNMVFDIASITKVFPALCFMKLTEENRISLDEPLCATFPEFRGFADIEKDGEVIGKTDRTKVTWFHVLTHTSGIGWARPKTRPSLPSLYLGIDEIFDLPFVDKIGEHIIYSDILYILLGYALERKTGLQLDELVRKMILEPCGLNKTGYRRISRQLDKRNTVPTEYDDVYRHRRIWGEVHDENAYQCDGVAAHAGIFSNAADLCRLGIELRKIMKNDEGLLRKKTFENMIYPHAVDSDGDRRGLMWRLKDFYQTSYIKGLSENAYGHEGFTGCFFWNDPDKDITVVFLSNDVYNGRDNRVLPRYRKQMIELALKMCSDNMG